jgi:hypothetical protein
MKRKLTCPVCGSEKVLVFIDDNAINQNKKECKCLNCSMLFTLKYFNRIKSRIFYKPKNILSKTVLRNKKRKKQK